MTAPNPPEDPGSLRSDVFAHVPEYLAPRLEDLWEAWRLAQSELDAAFAAWREDEREQAVERFAAYRAALDREQQAAAVVAEELAKERRHHRRR